MNDAPLTAPIRREYLLEPGEGVILSSDLGVFQERFLTFLTDSNLETEDVIASPVVRFPIPQARVGSDGELLRWGVDADPDLMWLPLFWLPPTVALRMQRQETEDGPTRQETDAEYLIRVASQLASSGLFDVETGSWLNVWRYFKIDENAEGFAERVEAWNDGGSDPEFESINLAPLLEGIDAPDSDTVISAALNAESYLRAQWALTAEQIGQSAVQAAEELQDDPEGAEAAAMTLCLTSKYGWAGGVTGNQGPIEDAIDDLIRRSQERVEPAQVLADLAGLAGDVFMTHREALEEVKQAAEQFEKDNQEAEPALT